MAATNDDKNSNYNNHLTLSLDVDPDVHLDPRIRRSISRLVKKRALARWKGHYKTADAYRQETDHVSKTLPFYPALHIVMQDIPRSLGGGSTWSLVYQLYLCLNSTGSVSSNTSNNNDNKKERDLGGAQQHDVVASATRSRPSSILHLAHKVLGMSISAASQQRNKSFVFYRHERDWLVEQVMQSLQSWAKVLDEQQ